MPAKLLRANVTIVAAYPEAFADFTQPTADELNNTDLVKNISCAIVDDYTLGMTDSDTDDSMSICDVGGVSSPTFKNYEASLDGFRDADLDADGVYNLFFNLFKHIDVPFVLVQRIGKRNDEAFAAGDVVSMFGVNTDNPIDLIDDSEMIRLGARFKSSGHLLTNFELTA